MKAHRIGLLVAALGSVALGALAPAVGCNGTGTTPICNFPDGANDPEAGCGELVEAAAAADVAVAEDVSVVDSPSGKPDASDATVPDAGSDAHVPDTGTDAHDASDAPHDAPHDSKG